MESKLDVGSLVGPYRIEALLGAGGMGQVYRARDTRLDRQVAIKTSREEFDSRFEREARTIAQLNHPHICTLHDVGPDYLVMELVEGESLSDRLKHGPLPLPLVLKFGAQMADALAAAHAKGIVHRDLKPHNVMIARSGVKVLDFGLAKAMPQHDETASMTQGIVGTPAYMAPEQRAGQPADARSDIYALGLVLAEMITGRRLAPGESASITGVPSQLSWAISRCLASDPGDRWQSARDLMATLERVGTAPIEPAGAGATVGRPRVWLTAAAVLAVAAVAGFVGYWLRPTPAASMFRFSIPPPPGSSFVSVAGGGAPAVSPDGRHLVFVADRFGTRSLWIQTLDAFEARPLSGTDGAMAPFWAPDSQSIGFVAAGTLKTIALAGGQPRVLTTGASFRTPAAWNHDGTILFSLGNLTLSTISIAGGDARRETEIDVNRLEENHFYPVFLPDRRHYLLQVRGGAELEYHILVGELGSKERRPILERVTNAQYAPSADGTSGYLVYGRDRTLVAQPFDVDRLMLTGPPITVVDRIAITPLGGGADFSVSPSGVLAYRTDEAVTHEMAWFDRQGAVVGTLGDTASHSRNSIRVSPDGKWLAFTRRGPESQDVWIHDLTRNVASRFTFGGGRTPVWSPDGSHIAYVRNDTVYRKPVTGGGVEVELWAGSGLLSVNDWSGDGKYLLLTRWDAKADRGLWLLPDPLANGRHELVLFESPALHGQFVPASGTPRWISYDAQEGRFRQVFVKTMPGEPSGKWQISITGGNGARWRRDGKEAFFSGPGSLMAVDMEFSPAVRFSQPRAEFLIPPDIAMAVSQYAPGYDVAPDGGRFIAAHASPEAPPSMIHIIVNWQNALTR
jgi:Tol biopolymer transport system component/predicted Ser/Thr protein kinase